MAITTIVMDVYKPGSELKNKVVNISDSFNARVGDNQVRLVIKYVERGIVERMEQEQLTPFMMGWVGQQDEEQKVTAETGIAVSYHGSTNDIIGGGKVRMDLPGTMFPQEGAFYGFFGLENSSGKRVTTNNVLFRIENNNPDMYVDTLPFRTELQKLLDLAQALIDKTDGTINDKLTEWADEVKKLIADGNADLDTYDKRLTLAEKDLANLLKEINDAGLLKQSDLDAALANMKADIKEGLDALKNINEDLIDVPDVDGGIPNYNIEPLQKLKANIDTTKFNLGFGTDYHYDVNTNYTQTFSGYAPELIAKGYRKGLRKSLNILSLSDKLDALVFNGDNVDSPYVSDLDVNRKIMVKEHKDFANTAFRITKCPTFLLKGNHDNAYQVSDANRFYDKVIHDVDFKEMYRQNGSFGEKRLSGSNYYYRDFTDKKIRLIGLDSADLPESKDDNGLMIFNRFSHSGFQQEQLNWLANEALQAPDGYSVLITMHWPVNHTVYDYADDLMINHGILKTIIEDYAAGCDAKEVTAAGDVPVDINYQFKKKGDLIAVLSGHRHLDQQVNINGVNYILTRCSLSTGDNMIREKRMEYEDTPLEDVFDIATVDTTARTLTMTRFGAGSEDQRYAVRTATY